MKKILINLSLLLIFTSLSIICAEVVARLMGYQPWRFTILENEPTTLEYNSSLGWRNKEGQYKFPPYYPGGSEVHMSFLKMGLRKTHKNQSNIRDDRPKIIFVGGSYTQGLAISDYETYPWKMQEHFPSFEVLNWGTAAYGTYQSLLTLEQILPSVHDPKIIIYGFQEHHEDRNVAPAYWLASLSRYSKRSHVFVPYATVDNNNKLIRHPPEAYTLWPFSDKLSIILLLEDVLMNVKTYKREAQKRIVAQKILLQMQKLSDRYSARFLVAMLEVEERTKTQYKEFLESNSIMAIDCVFPIGGEMRVRGEGHPNGDMNSKWASCIEDFLCKHSLTTH